MVTESKSSGKAMKKKRLNKNKKRNWRKHIDISDVEKALEDERLELRTGGLVSEKPDHELFFLDKTAEGDSKAKQRRDKKLKVDQIIVPDPAAVRLPSATSKRAKLRQQKSLEKKLKNQSNRSARLRSSQKTTAFDLWSNESQDLYDKEMKKTEVTKYTESVVGKSSTARPDHLLMKPNDVEGYKYRDTPAVEVAHPGASYNPTYDDHQNLLAKAHVIEVNKDKVQKRIERALYVPYEELADPDTFSMEMQEGLFEEEQQVTFEDNEGSAEAVPNPPVRAIDRKTTRSRKRELKEKIAKQEKEKEWGKKLRENEVYRTKTFLAEIKAKERKIAERRELRSKKTRMLTLSNVKFSEQDIELKLSDEIKGSLRELKPESGLLTDRYKSFQKRGIVEPRCKRNKPKSKKKVKYQEKRSWREIEA